MPPWTSIALSSLRRNRRGLANGAKSLQAADGSRSISDCDTNSVTIAPLT
jgi:hypothetical protein